MHSSYQDETHLNGTHGNASAAPPTIIRVRCPDCRKLYSIDPNDLHSAQPFFECVACKSKFSFKRDQIPMGGFVIAKTVKPANADELQSLNLAELTNSLRECPECHQNNPKARKDCLRCGLIFEKAALAKDNDGTKAIPTLVKTYQDLLKDYQNFTKHMSFVDQCEELQALPFALKKYRNLKAVQPNDPIAKKMWDSIVFRGLLSTHKQLAKFPQIERFLTQIPWRKVMKLSPLVLAMTLIVVGMASGTLRNMVGMGAALLFMIFGINWFIKGRLRLQDFWE